MTAPAQPATAAPVSDGPVSAYRRALRTGSGTPIQVQGRRLRVGGFDAADGSEFAAEVIRSLAVRTSGSPSVMRTVCS